MVCPSCGETVVDTEAAFCSRCGAPLGSEQAEATARLDVPGGGGTTELTPDGVSEAIAPAPDTGEPDPVARLPRGVTHALARSWLDAVSAACLTFLLLIGVGAIFLLAAKFQYSGFGAGANPIEILSAIAIVGLAILRAPVHIGHLVITALPLGGLLVIGIGAVWACNATSLTSNGDLRRGLKFAPPFALVCWIAAIAFRFRGKEPVFAGAWGTLFWSLFWGAAFGVIAAYMKRRGPHLIAREWLHSVDKEGPIRRGVVMATVMLTVGAVVGAAAVLLLVIGGLISGGPRGEFGFGDAIAAILYLIAFLPNLVVAVIALGMGAPIEVGARVTVAGSTIARAHDISWFGDHGAIALGLVVVPLVATVAAGYWAARPRIATDLWRVVAAAAVTFATVVTLLAWLGEARVGAGLLGKGLARIDVQPLWAFLAGLLWAGAGATAGWFLRLRRWEKT
jgi:hypothetical protein